MHERTKEKLNLRRLILLLCVFSVVITLLNSFYSIYRVQRELLIENTIESNRVYAEKMAEMTDVFIESGMDQLEYSAKLLVSKMDDPTALKQEIDRLRIQTKSFNSVVIVNAEGVIVSISPETVRVKGMRLKSERSLQSLKAQRPLITDPFVSPAGNYLTSMSYPIFSANGKYLGYVGGTIYLEKENVLKTLLGKHSYKDGSYLYVVDRHGTLIYHPDKNRVGEVITTNQAINAVTAGQYGGQDIVNSQGIEMLAGYAPVKFSGWGIVAQRPKTLTLAELDEHMLNVLWESIPIGLLTLLLIWISAIFISKPLWQLASTVKAFDNHSSTIEELKAIEPWYYEASHLKRNFLKALNIVSSTIDKLHSDSMTDALTGLLNRRGLEKAVENLRANNVSFSLLALDIDHFKKVNDTFGHDAGDELLKEVAQLMKLQARELDIVCRSGGEEFMIFLANTDLNQAFEVGERIRKSLETHDFSIVSNVTISIGVSRWAGEPQTVESAMKEADRALYLAKENGRNRTELA